MTAMRKNGYMATLLATLLALLAPAGAGAQGVNIVLAKESMTVAEVIAEIERQTEYRFAYNRNEFDTSRSVSTGRRTVSLTQALESVTGGQNVKHVVHKNYIAIVPIAATPAPAPAAPQVRRQAAQRTSDVYRPGETASWGGPVRRAPSTPAAPSPAPVTAPEPVAEFYSDYRPLTLPGEAPGRLPRVALKTNLMYGGATLTPNIAAEVALAPRWTLEAAYSSNPWNYRAEAAGETNRKLLHGVARVEGRWWLCERFSGHFLGLHGLYSEYNVAGWDIPLLFAREYRYKGNAWGGGVAWGYDLPLGRSWNVEFTAGVGVYTMRYDRYSCLTCSTDRTPQSKTWVGPSRVGVSLEFLMK